MIYNQIVTWTAFTILAVFWCIRINIFHSHGCCLQGSEQKHQSARHGFCQMPSQQFLMYPWKTDTKYPSANHNHHHHYHNHQYHRNYNRLIIIIIPCLILTKSVCQPHQTALHTFGFPVSSLPLKTWQCKPLEFKVLKDHSRSTDGSPLGGFTYQWENFKVVFLKSTLYFLVAFVFLITKI